MQPLDALGGCGARLRGVGGTALECHGGEIDRRDVPAALRQPDRVGALAAAQVQRRAGGEVGGRRDEVRVGVAAPQPAVGSVALIPECLVELICHDGISLSAVSLPASSLSALPLAA